MPNTALIFSKRFLPLFGVQFLGAFNDNLFKSALVMLVVFRLAESTQESGLLTTLAAGIFILPFFLLSAFAGKIADTYEKTKLIQRIKFAEILIMGLGAWALVSQSLVGLFVVLFLMGSQSAFFGPIKYAVLPEHLAETELTQGNAWFSGSTFFAILIGTVIGGWMVLLDSGTQVMAGLVIFMAVLGYFLSLLIPKSHDRQFVSTDAESSSTLWRFLTLTHQEVAAAKQHRHAFLAVLAISWFWFLGASYLSQMPVMVKEVLWGNEAVVLLFLTTFSVGIALGAWSVNVLVPKFKSLSALKYHGVLLACLSLLMLLSNVAMSGFILPPLLPDAEVELRTIAHFFGDTTDISVLISHWVVWLSLLLISTIGGAYIVPLYTHLQTHSPEYFRGRMIAVNNIVNSFLMVLSAIFFLIGYAVGLDLLGIFYGLALMNLAVAIGLHRRIVALSRHLTF